MTSPFTFGAVEAEPITISALELDVVWEQLRLGQLPLIIKVPSPGTTDEERERIEQRVWAQLDSRGLGRPAEVHPELEDMLSLLARPDLEVDGRAFANGKVRLLAASLGEAAVLAELRDDWLTLRRIPSTALASSVIGALPASGAGAGRSVTLRTEDFETAARNAGRTKEAFTAALLATGVRADDAEALTEMIKDVANTGNFGAAARDRLGRRRRAGRVVSFFDTEDGRYVQIRRESPDGTLWTTISPADVRNLVHHVEELLGEARREAEA